MSFLRSFQLGADAAETGIQAYDRSRSWADKLTERQAKQAAVKLEGERYEEKRVDDAEKMRDERQFKANEAALDRRGRGLDRAQRDKREKSGVDEWRNAQRLDKATANFLTARTAKDSTGVQAYGDIIKKLGGDIPTEEDENLWWWQKGTPKYQPGGKPAAAPGAPAGGPPKDWRSY